MPLPRHPDVALGRVAGRLEDMHFAPAALEPELHVADGDGLDQEVREALARAEAAAHPGVGLAHPGEEDGVGGDPCDVDLAEGLVGLPCVYAELDVFGGWQ